MRTALRAEPVLFGVELPVNLLRRDLDEVTGTVLSAGTPHLLVIRTPGPGLVWYGAIHSRSSEAIAATEVLDGWSGYFTRDDDAGWHQYDPTLADVQLCCAHLIRALRAVLLLAPNKVGRPAHRPAPRGQWPGRWRPPGRPDQPRPGDDRRSAGPL